MNSLLGPILDAHHDVNGTNAVFVGTAIVLGIMGWRVIMDAIRDESGVPLFKRIARVDIARMLLGAVIGLCGLAIRIGFWIPWRGMLAAGQDDLAADYRSLSNLWSHGGAVIASTGVAIAMWPFLKRKFGRWALAAPFVFYAAFYTAGYFTTDVIAYFLR